MAKVSFETRRGKKVSFRTRPVSQQGKKKPLSASARFVKKNIGDHAKKGSGALAATMDDYKAAKRSK